MQRVGKSQAPLFRLPSSLVPPLRRIRFGFSGLVNIHRQLGDICRNPPRLIFAEVAWRFNSPGLALPVFQFSARLN
jgi:hypothetical protein